MQPNSLYFGNNLAVLSEREQDGTYRFPSESVDLIYLDPPFNSNRDYNLIFREQSGDKAEAQIKAFTDTWTWDQQARDTLEDITGAGVNEGRIPDRVARLIDSLVRGIGHNDMSAYLVNMTPRLVHLHRILKRTGSLYLHCDPTANGYLRVLLDAIFGPENFRNEIVWQRTAAKGDARRKLGANHDVILAYGKSDAAYFTPARREPDAEYLARFTYDDNDGRGPYRLAPLDSPNPRPNLTYEYKGYSPPAKGWRVSRAVMEHLDAEGRLAFPRAPTGRIARKHYLREQDNPTLGDVWTDIPPLQAASTERLGYPTQKPLPLLERIIGMASERGGVVLDPFCGCGTALVAAQKLGRKWIGIDITHLSIAVMRARLMDSFGLVDVPVHGVPEDIESARMLAAESKDGRYEFQWWALSKIDARPLGGERKKGADRGIDGVLTFTERDSIQRILVSVKSGKPSLLHVKELIATLETEKGAIGVLIELDEPTSEMRRAALEAGQYESDLWGGRYERIQILTVTDLLDGKKPNVPKFLPGYQKAARIAAEQGEQQSLGLGG